MPPDLDSHIESAAASEGRSYSGWLAAVARQEFTIRLSVTLRQARNVREHAGGGLLDGSAFWPVRRSWLR
jgi:hypothetical protein